MKAQITIHIDISEPESFEKTVTDVSLKTCPNCGQSRIPFKKGVCICGAPVGSIRYVSNAEKFALGQYHSCMNTTAPNVEKLAIEELMDN